jgi:low temperature requirement protein LtrA
MAITFQALFVMVATRKRAFVIAITAKVRRSGYTLVHDRKGAEPMTKMILTVVAALAVTIGALTITGARDDNSSTPTMLTLPLLY